MLTDLQISFLPKYLQEQYRRNSPPDSQELLHEAKLVMEDGEEKPINVTMALFQQIIENTYHAGDKHGRFMSSQDDDNSPFHD